MRQFIVHGHAVPPTAEVSLDDLPGAGRLDLLARCVTASFLLSHGIRDDVRTHLVVNDEFTVQFDGSQLRGLHPDERSTAALIRTALEEKAEAIGQIPVETSPGVSLIRRGFEGTLADVASSGTVVQLHEDGEPAVDVSVPAEPIFVLSDHQDFTDDEDALLAAEADHRLRVGPEALHADHTITVVHNWCDTDGFRSC
ncbi:tRNA (pseudouridine(54)-N(1))-methyltransferase TrmY [Halobacteriaceae bacterium SHR40]|uniref:tRNA (pseudouridine(54)-N(1))-methyltransferase TrmY n=1 Tax=Halovenus amylolytica TaxID=2500550 RepID=UPI000FE2EB8D